MSATRAAFLARTGALVVGFSLPATWRPAAAQVVGKPPQFVDAFLAIDGAGNVTVKFGKVELGTGIATAIAQIVADELDVAFARITVPEARTIGFPDQGYTAGSASLSAGAIPIRRAAAEARRALLELAAAKFNVPVTQLQTANGVVSVTGGGPQAAYGDLIGPDTLHRTLAADTKVKSPDTYQVVGKPLPRVDIPGKVYGNFGYTQNLRLPGMLHGRVVRPVAVGATIAHVDVAGLKSLPGVRVVRRGDAFIGVVAPSEWVAIKAMRALNVTWRGGGIRQAPDLADAVRATPLITTSSAVATGDTSTIGPGALSATYVWPYQTHGSIGPSCAIADVRADRATIWSATQGIFPLRGALAQLLHLPADAVEVRFVEGSGCYGHNGADDAAADAALLSQVAGKPVRVQWMRDQEHGWDPKGPAMVMTFAARLDDQRAHVTTWTSDVWSPSHSARPNGEAGNLLAGKLTGAPPPGPQWVGGDRNAKVNYVVPNYRVTLHNLQDGVLHSSALRGLGGTQNTFANESFMDELAHLAGADPLAFRRAHLANDQRALDLLTALETLAAWTARPAASRVDPHAAQLAGRGIAFVHYENTEAYVAAVADVVVTRATGEVRVKQLAIAHDCGVVVNPDGLRNQIEGNAVQAMSRALKEQVTYNAQRVTSIDWATYPIVRFRDVPQIRITLVNRIHEPIKGAGEATTTIIAPAINNAIFDATGVRLREVPFTPQRVKAALA